MNISKHTPGPWTYMYTRIGHTVRQGKNAMSALMVVNVSDNPKADGMLMAAAPDLLAALDDAIKMINARPGIDQSVLLRMYAAYNKATKG